MQLLLDGIQSATAQPAATGTATAATAPDTATRAASSGQPITASAAAAEWEWTEEIETKTEKETVRQSAGRNAEWTEWKGIESAERTVTAIDDITIETGNKALAITATECPSTAEKYGKFIGFRDIVQTVKFQCKWPRTRPQ